MVLRYCLDTLRGHLTAAGRRHDRQQQILDIRAGIVHAQETDNSTADHNGRCHQAFDALRRKDLIRRRVGDIIIRQRRDEKFTFFLKLLKPESFVYTDV